MECSLERFASRRGAFAAVSFGIARSPLGFPLLTHSFMITVILEDRRCTGNIYVYRIVAKLQRNGSLLLFLFAALLPRFHHSILIDDEPSWLTLIDKLCNI